MNHRANNFDALRFWAAMGVLWSHTFVVIGRAAERPLQSVSHAQTDLGAVGVTIFFVISGYLITQSFVRSKSIWRFVKARVLRIVPALWVLLVLLGLVVGPLVSELSPQEYLSSWAVYRFLAVNGSLLDVQSQLPGVFSDNPFDIANASLWSLPVEIRCYALVFALGILGLLKRHVTLVLFLLGLTYLFFNRELFDHPHPSVNLDATIDQGTTFLAGALLYLWGAKLNWVAAIVCAALTLLSLSFGGFWLAEHTVLPYVVIYLALGPLRLPNMARYGDLSYGIYIYAWPVSQLFVMYLGVSSSYRLGVLVAPVTICLALLSWHLVEKSALSLKEHLLPGERVLSTSLERVADVFSSSSALRKQAMRGVHALRGVGLDAWGKRTRRRRVEKPSDRHD